MSTMDKDRLEASIAEIERIGREYPDGVHTCAELQKLEPGRRPCTCGRCPVEIDMIAGTMTPRDGVELQFAVQEVSDGDVRVILRVGGRVAAKLNEDEQDEFLGHYLAARAAALKVKRDLRTGRTRDY